jgi:hypothetical protein
MQQNNFCIKQDGSVEILISPDGLPSAVVIVPTVCCKPEERLKKIQNVLDSYALQGYWVSGWKWIRNPVFDKKGEKTTAEIRYRICKNQDEAKILVGKIKEIIDKERKNKIEKIRVDSTRDNLSSKSIKPVI